MIAMREQTHVRKEKRSPLRREAAFGLGSRIRRGADTIGLWQTSNKHRAPPPLLSALRVTVESFCHRRWQQCNNCCNAMQNGLWKMYQRVLKASVWCLLKSTERDRDGAATGLPNLIEFERKRPTRKGTLTACSSPQVLFNSHRNL